MGNSQSNNYQEQSQNKFENNGILFKNLRLISEDESHYIDFSKEGIIMYSDEYEEEVLYKLENVVFYVFRNNKLQYDHNVIMDDLSLTKTETIIHLNEYSDDTMSIFYFKVTNDGKLICDNEYNETIWSNTIYYDKYHKNNQNIQYIHRLYNNAINYTLPFKLFSRFNNNYLLFDDEGLILLKDQYHKILKVLKIDRWSKYDKFYKLSFKNNELLFNNDTILFSNNFKNQYITLDAENNIQFILVDGNKVLTTYELTDFKDIPEPEY